MEINNSRARIVRGRPTQPSHNHNSSSRAFASSGASNRENKSNGLSNGQSGIFGLVKGFLGKIWTGFGSGRLDDKEDSNSPSSDENMSPDMHVDSNQRSHFRSFLEPTESMEEDVSSQSEPASSSGQHLPLSPDFSSRSRLPYPADVDSSDQLSVRREPSRFRDPSEIGNLIMNKSTPARQSMSMRSKQQQRLEQKVVSSQAQIQGTPSGQKFVGFSDKMKVPGSAFGIRPFSQAPSTTDHHYSKKRKRSDDDDGGNIEYMNGYGLGDNQDAEFAAPSAKRRANFDLRNQTPSHRTTSKLPVSRPHLGPYGVSAFEAPLTPMVPAWATPARPSRPQDQTSELASQTSKKRKRLDLDLPPATSLLESAATYSSKKRKRIAKVVPTSTLLSLPSDATASPTTNASKMPIGGLFASSTATTASPPSPSETTENASKKRKLTEDLPQTSPAKPSFTGFKNAATSTTTTPAAASSGPQKPEGMSDAEWEEVRPKPQSSATLAFMSGAKKTETAAKKDEEPKKEEAAKPSFGGFKPSSTFGAKPTTATPATASSGPQKPEGMSDAEWEEVRPKPQNSATLAFMAGAKKTETEAKKDEEPKKEEAAKPSFGGFKPSSTFGAKSTAAIPTKDETAKKDEEPKKEEAAKPSFGGFKPSSTFGATPTTATPATASSGPQKPEGMSDAEWEEVRPKPQNSATLAFMSGAKKTETAAKKDEEPKKEEAAKPSFGGFKPSSTFGAKPTTATPATTTATASSGPQKPEGMSDAEWEEVRPKPQNSATLAFMAGAKKTETAAKKDEEPKKEEAAKPSFGGFKPSSTFGAKPTIATPATTTAVASSGPQKPEGMSDAEWEEVRPKPQNSATLAFMAGAKKTETEAKKDEEPKKEEAAKPSFGGFKPSSTFGAKLTATTKDETAKKDEEPKKEEAAKPSFGGFKPSSTFGAKPTTATPTSTTTTPAVASSGPQKPEGMSDAEWEEVRPKPQSSATLAFMSGAKKTETSAKKDEEPKKEEAAKPSFGGFKPSSTFGSKPSPFAGATKDETAAKKDEEPKKEEAPKPSFGGFKSSSTFGASSAPSTVPTTPATSTSDAQAEPKSTFKASALSFGKKPETASTTAPAASEKTEAPKLSFSGFKSSSETSVAAPASEPAVPKPTGFTGGLFGSTTSTSFGSKFPSTATSTAKPAELSSTLGTTSAPKFGTTGFTSTPSAPISTNWGSSGVSSATPLQKEASKQAAFSFNTSAPKPAAAADPLATFRNKALQNSSDQTPVSAWPGSTTSSTPATGLFSSSTSSSGSGLFGSSTTSSFGANSTGFASVKSTSGFSSTTPASTGFGTTTSTPTSLFGGASTTSTPSGLFSSTPSSTGFGSSGASSSSFGSSGFGSTNTSTGFGSTSSSTGFGTASGGFGSASGSTGFGSSAPTGFGSSSGPAGFGSSSASTGFGSSQPMFGSSSTPSGNGMFSSGSSFGGATPLLEKPSGQITRVKVKRKH